MQALNLILLTAGEVRGLRDSLRGAAASEEGRTNFTALYPCWSHSAGEGEGQLPAVGCAQQLPATYSARAQVLACLRCCQYDCSATQTAAFFLCNQPGLCLQHTVLSCLPLLSRLPGALLSLCLLAQVYSHTCDLIQNLAQLPLGAEVLVQVDRLVQLLETPAYAFLRLQLLEPSRNPDLLKSLYGLLMLLPQSSAFKTLSARLQSVPAVTLLQLETVQQQQQGAKVGSSSKQQQQQADQQHQWADWAQLLQGFVVRQEAHAADEERRRLLIEGLRIEEDIAKEQQHQAAMAALEQQQAGLGDGSI